MAKFYLALALLMGYAAAVPLTASEEAVNEVLQVNRLDNKLAAIYAALGCAGQSCDIADLSGSTGRLPTKRPEGGGTSDFKCIGTYNPEGMKLVEKLPNVAKQPNGVSGALMGAAHSLGGWIPGGAPTSKGKFTGKCAPNILIFAKGTLETGELGITVGPALNSGLPKDWRVVGVSYTADLAGDYCLGLPGGMVAKDMLNQAAAKCPDSKIFMSGYSQGGMISHNAVAYAEPQARKRVMVRLCFLFSSIF
jgi:hypothetical protein